MGNLTLLDLRGLGSLLGFLATYFALLAPKVLIAGIPKSSSRLCSKPSKSLSMCEKPEDKLVVHGGSPTFSFPLRTTCDTLYGVTCVRN